MPNIYLRLPRSRCQFFRHRDPKHIIPPDEPLVFNQYTPHFRVLSNHATNAQAVTQQVTDQCYSQQQWRNMLNGRHPCGGQIIIPRNRQDYLTFAEVQTLCGRRDYDKSASEDYLCIKLPYEIDAIDTVRPITPSWNLDTEGRRQLIQLLNNDFKRSVVDWALATFDFMTSNGRLVCRDNTALLERFLMRYGIEPTTLEKDNLRRVVDRWLRTEHYNFSAFSCRDMQYIDNKENAYTINGIEWK